VRGSHFEDAIGPESEGDPPSVPEGGSTGVTLRLRRNPRLLVGTSGDPLPDDRVMGILKGLVSDPTNHVVLVSGRPRRDLEPWFGELPATLIAEHGAWVRDRVDREWRSTLPLEESWKVRVRPVMERFLDQVPGSFLEEKDFSIA